MPPGFYYNEGTGRSYIDATRIDCSQLNAANVSANSVSSASLSGGAQNGLGQQVVDYTATTTTSNALYIINKPVLSNVATSGAYSSLTGVPTLSNVAITGAYSSLTGTPVLANVATTGLYSSLAGRPANLSSFTNDLTNFGNIVSNSVSVTGNVTISKALAVTGDVATNLLQLPNANFTGQYSELKGTPNAAYTASSNIGTLVASSIAANTLTMGANVDYPVNITQNYTSGVNNYSHAITSLNPLQSLGEVFLMQVGQTASTYGTSYLGHVNQGSNNSTCYATIGLYGQDRILNVTGNRQVGINTTTPQYALDVGGKVQSNGVIVNGAVSIVYNPSTVGLVCASTAQMAYTQFVTPTGYSCPTVAYTNSGTATYSPNAANTVTTQMNFVCGAQQAGNAAAIQVKDDGQPFYVNGGLVQPSAYISFQTGATERLLIGNSGMVTVAGNISTTSVTQTGASYLSRYQLSSNVAVASGGSSTLNTWSTSPAKTVGQAASVSCDGTNFTINRAGIYNVLYHVRFNATASENSSLLYSSSGTWGASVLNQSGTAAYDPNSTYTGYLAKADVLYATAFSSATNSVLANSFNIPTFMQFTLLTPCA